MQTHIAHVRGRRIAWDERRVVQNGLNSDRVELDLDGEWRECDRVQAVMSNGGEPVRVLVEGEGLTIPSSLMAETGALRTCLIGYVGDEVRIVTERERMPLSVVESGDVSGLDPAPEQPDLWARLMDEVERAAGAATSAASSATEAARDASTAASDVREAAERGDFDGKTPVRGVDYWTEADREPIESATSAANLAARDAKAAAEAAANGESVRAEAESARVEAESARERAESRRAAAEAERERLVSQAVSDAEQVTANATEAAGRAGTAAEAADIAAGLANAAAESAKGNVLKGTSTGALAHVDDAYPSPVLGLSVYGESRQESTTGKNLFDWDLYTGGYDFDKSESNRGLWYARLHVGAGVECTASVDKIVNSGQYLAVADGPYSDKTISIFLAHDTVAIKSGTVPADANGDVWLYFNNNDDMIRSLYETGLKVQVEVGDAATAWEPYTGGRPSPSPEYPQPITSVTECDVTAAGRNLFDVSEESVTEKYAKGNYTISDGSITFDTSSSWGSDYIYFNRVAVDGDIYLSMVATDPSIQNDNNGAKFLFRAYDASGAEITDINDAVLSNISQWGYYNNHYLGFYERIITKGIRLSPGPKVASVVLGICFFDNVTGTHVEIRHLQAEVGAKATDYAPHVSASTSIDLQGRELRSLPNGVRDELVVDGWGNVSMIQRVGSATLDGTEIWKAEAHPNGIGVYRVSTTLKNHMLKPTNKDGLSNLYKCGYTWNTESFAITSNGATLHVCDAAHQTAEAMTEFLKGTPLVIYGELAQPQTIPLGKITPPRLPEATSNVWNSGGGEVSVEHQRDVNIVIGKLEQSASAIPAIAAATL